MSSYSIVLDEFNIKFEMTAIVRLFLSQLIKNEYNNFFFEKTVSRHHFTKHCFKQVTPFLMLYDTHLILSSS